MKKEKNAIVFLASLIALHLSVLLVNAQSSAQIIVNPTQGPPGSTIEVTLIGWTSSPGGDVYLGTRGVAICTQKGDGSQGIFALVPVENSEWVKTGLNTWKRSYYLASAYVFEGENIITVREGPYAQDFIAETTFNVVYGNSPPPPISPDGSKPPDLAVPVAIGAGGAVIAAVAVIGANRLTRRRRRRTMEDRREVGEDTGISYERPPETFVQEWDPPRDLPEKPSTREEILVRWALTPENVKQAWRDYEICRQEAIEWIAQIKVLNIEREAARRIHMQNILKATTKLGLQTAGIIADGVQMAYLERLRAAREASRLKNDFERATLLESSLAEVEKYTRSMAEAKQALKDAMQSAARLKDALAVWGRRMEVARMPGWEGRGEGWDAMHMIDSLKLDPSTSRYLSGNNSPLEIFHSGKVENVKSPQDALTYALKSALKSALADMRAWGYTLEGAQKKLPLTLKKAEMILESSTGVGDTVIEAVDKAIGKPAALGGLDMDDPAMLAEGQANLERLQSRINWLQKHYQIAVNCTNENMRTIRRYNEAQQVEQNRSEVKSEGEMSEK